MKKYFPLVIALFVLSVLYTSCNKDSNPVGGNPVTYTVTNKYTRSTNKSVPNVDTLTIPDNGNMISLSFSLDTINDVDGNKNLELILVHNNIVDTLIKKFTNPGFVTYNFINAICVDSAEFNLAPGQATYTGLFKPYQPLSVFNGTTLNGPWYLISNYSTLNKTGVIKSWGITITYNSPIAPPSNIVPLAVGNSWSYSIDTGSIPNVFTATMNITEQTTVHGKNVYKWQWLNQNNYWLVRNESDGLYWYGYVSPTFVDTTTTPFVWIKYPISLNERYFTKQWNTGYTDTLTCTNTNAAFSGYSECTKYSANTTWALDAYSLNSAFLPVFIGGPNQNRTGDYYFKSGVGYVGNEVYSNTIANGVTFQRYKLTTYNIHK